MFNRRIAALLSAIGLAVAPWAAEASPSGTFVRVAAVPSGTEPCGSINVFEGHCLTGPGTQTVTLPPGGATATGSASEQAQTASVSALDSLGAGASGTAEFWDTYAFSDLLPGATAHIVVTGTDTVSGSGSVTIFGGLFQAGLIYPPLGGNDYQSIPSSPDFTISFDVPVLNGTFDNGPYVLDLGVAASAFCDPSAPSCADSASATIDSVTLTVPDGASFISTAVPEPSSAALAAFAFTVPLLRRRSRAKAC